MLDALVAAGDEPDDLFRGVARDVLDALRSRGVEIPERIADADYGYDAISHADAVVSKLIAGGVRIPESLG